MNPAMAHDTQLTLAQPLHTAMAPPPPRSGAAGLLARQLKEMQSDKNLPGISCGLVNDSNVFEWEVMLMISDDCKYYGGKHHTTPYQPTPRTTN
jgi:hypothetical protein